MTKWVINNITPLYQPLNNGQNIREIIKFQNIHLCYMNPDPFNLRLRIRRFLPCLSAKSDVIEVCSNFAYTRSRSYYSGQVKKGPKLQCILTNGLKSNSLIFSYLPYLSAKSDVMEVCSNFAYTRSSSCYSEYTKKKVTL